MDAPQPTPTPAPTPTPEPTPDPTPKPADPKPTPTPEPSPAPAPAPSPADPSLDVNDRVSALEAAQDKKAAIDEFLQSEDGKFQDVPRDLLEVARSEEELSTIGKRWIDNQKKVEQEAIKKAQTIEETPKLTQAQKTEQLKDLKDSGNLEAAFGLMFAPTSD